MPMDSGMGTFAFGQPADPTSADRTIEIVAQDNFTFDPDQTSITVGETVTFRVRNAGAIAHELTLGPIALQQEHETEMQAMPSGMMMADEPNAIAVQPGETRELTWTFTQAGTFQYACHEPGHYGAGMFGTITVSGS
ncbi:MAG: plastocyanin/azurin family copper-binding protein [Candidatus Limnocylindrales bacterium]